MRKDTEPTRLILHQRAIAVARDIFWRDAVFDITSPKVSGVCDFIDEEQSTKSQLMLLVASS
jgi:hypothetical protein